FRNLETNGNPWGIGFAQRADWTAGLGLRTLAEHPDAEYLFWVGCAGSFDENGKSIARDMAALLQKADVDFAILGAEEKCCGDSARRLGQEYLFQTLAAENLAVFARYRFRKILTICPHGYNTLKNEYPALLGRVPGLSDGDKARLRGVPVIHHAELLAALVAEGRLRIEAGTPQRTAYHDPCYLGRHNGILEQPRELIGRLSGGKTVELGRSREHSFCCGAGGGLMWTEESLGKRINHLRADEALATGAAEVATACPFCQTMLRDALKDKDRSDVKVRDIAQILAARIR
ncbi:MAG: (Fe-S)-binding protein, partial [Candidatus Aminicenantales bacterium]